MTKPVAAVGALNLNEPNQRFSLINGYRNVEIKSYDSIRQEETGGDWFAMDVEKAQRAYGLNPQGKYQKLKQYNSTVYFSGAGIDGTKVFDPTQTGANFDALFCRNGQLKQAFIEREHWLHLLYVTDILQLTTLIQACSEIASMLHEKVYHIKLVEDVKNLLVSLSPVNKQPISLEIQFSEDPNRMHFLVGFGFSYMGYDSGHKNDTLHQAIQGLKMTGLLPSDFDFEKDLRQKVFRDPLLDKGSSGDVFRVYVRQAIQFQPQQNGQQARFTVQPAEASVVFHSQTLVDSLIKSSDTQHLFSTIWMPEEPCIWPEKTLPSQVIDCFLEGDTTLPLISSDDDKKKSISGAYQNIGSKQWLSTKSKVALGVMFLAFVYLVLLTVKVHPLMLLTSIQSFWDVRILTLIGIGLYGLAKIPQQRDGASARMLALTYGSVIVFAIVLVATQGIPLSALSLTSTRLLSEMLGALTAFGSGLFAFVYWSRQDANCCKLCHILPNPRQRSNRHERSNRHAESYNALFNKHKQKPLGSTNLPNGSEAKQPNNEVKAVVSGLIDDVVVASLTAT